MSLSSLSFIGSDQIKRHGGIYVSRRTQIRAVVGIACVVVGILSIVPWIGRGVRAASPPNASISAPSTGRTAHAVAHPNASVSQNYASPLEVLLSPDGTRLYVLCQQSNEVRILNASNFALIKTIAVGRVPRGFSLSLSGNRLYVANSWDDTLSVIDTVKQSVTATWPVGEEPSSVAVDKTGSRLFVANRISNDVAVLDAHTGKEEKRLAAGRGASYLALSPDDDKLYVSHVYPNPPALRTGRENRTAPESEITVIDTAQAAIVDHLSLHEIAGVFHLALSADGRLGVVAELHPKNLVPLAHLEHGGAFVDSITLFGADVGKPVEIPLDELERYASQPFGVAIAPDKSRIYITSGGSEIVTVVDVPRLLNFIHTHAEPYALSLSASSNYVVARIPVGLNPRGLTLSRDGQKLFVANRLEDTVSVIDTRTNRVASTIALAGSTPIPTRYINENAFNIASSVVDGQITCTNCHTDGRTQSQYAPTPKDLAKLITAHKNYQADSLASTGSKRISPLRRGEQTFYTSRYSFQGQIGCANCHIDSTFDGITWDLEPDGFGRDIVDNRTLEDIKGTEPYKWNGNNPSIPVEDGPRTEKYFWRSENYDSRTLTYLASYIRSLPPRPNRFSPSKGKLTPSQARGKALFERAVDSTGKEIPVFNQCAHCHSGPKGTDQRSFEVGTRKLTDNVGPLDTPQLTNIALTAPYLHDGSARTLEEIWTIYNPTDQHGRTRDLTPEDIHDLAEYLKTQ
jgi:YVTN family beta-propeller protein